MISQNYNESVKLYNNFVNDKRAKTLEIKLKII